MHVKILSPGGGPQARQPAVITSKRDAVASPAAGGAVDPLRWRFTLESLWEGKVDQVNALAGACQGVSAAGDDLPGDGATMPSFRLYLRAARAYDELAAIADAIERVDAGTFGLCADCGEQMAREWLAASPVTRYCPACSVPAARSAEPGAEVVTISFGRSGS